MKASGSVWHHGTALYLISQVEWFSLPRMREYFKNPMFTTVSAYGTMLYQIWFPLALFSRLKLVWLLGGISLHVGIGVFMGLLTFSATMISLDLFLISDQEYERLHALGRRFRNRLLSAAEGHVPERSLALYVDGFCKYCRATGRLLERLDARRALSVMSFRHTDDYRRYGISEEALEKRIHLVDTKTGKARSGFDALRELTKVLRWLYPLRPLFALIALSKQGDRVYDFVASRRPIVAGLASCSGHCAKAEDSRVSVRTARRS
jgi:predicted DCC family thiol-disulfide oxidoreductase YuxK